MVATVYGAWILGIEDDPDDQLIMRRALEEATDSVRLECVPDGPAAVDLLAGVDTLPRVVLLDLNLPKVRGDEFLPKLRAASNHYLPVVMLTTSSEQRDIVSSYRQGAAAFVTKPDSYTGMVELMKSIIDFWFTQVKVA